MPEKPPLPENHAEYDAHLLYASACGPQHEVMEIQYAEPHKRFLNPWLPQWHTKPKVDLPSFTIADFAEDVRRKLEMEIRIRFNNNHRAETLLRYIPHIIIQHACTLHTGKFSNTNQILIAVRRDLQFVFQHGYYSVETPAHPFWVKYRGRDIEQEGGHVSRYITDKRPTTHDKKLAEWLAGPQANLTGPEGCISDILWEKCPFLLELDHGRLMYFEIELRRRLMSVVKRSEGFGPQDRHKCVEMIIDAWQRAIGKKGISELASFEGGWSAPVPEMADKYFSEGDIDDIGIFESRMKILEQLTAITCMESEGDPQDKIDDIIRINEIWKRAMLTHRIVLYDYPSLALVFLALDAVTNSKEGFMDNI